MNCADCTAELKPVRTHGIELDKCPECSGVWFDAGEIEAYRAAQTETPPPYEFSETAPRQCKTCPSCVEPSLTVGSAQGVQLYRCDRCHGFFLPRQERGADVAVSALDLSVEGALWFGPEIWDLISGVFDLG